MAKSKSEVIVVGFDEAVVLAWLRALPDLSEED